MTSFHELYVKPIENFNFAEVDLENLGVGVSCFSGVCWVGSCEVKENFEFFYDKEENVLRKRCAKHAIHGSYKLSDKDIFLLKINGKI